VFFVQAIQALSESGAAYCVVGGLAVSLHGIPRTTYDLDIVVLPERDNLVRVDGALRTLGLAPKLPIELAELGNEDVRLRWLTDRNLIAVSYGDPSDPLREVDVLVSPPVDSVRALLARASMVSVGRATLPLVSIRDLVEMKRRAGRPQDLADVMHLERLLGGGT
jgi:hypothetical protein